jgi:hypothetical protein
MRNDVPASYVQRKKKGDAEAPPLKCLSPVKA